MHFFKNPATPEIYTLSLHDALPISQTLREFIIKGFVLDDERLKQGKRFGKDYFDERSEEHTSELQSPYDLVCRLLLEKKNYIVSREWLASTAFSQTPWRCQRNIHDT